MRILKIIIPFLLVGIISGCSNLQGAKLLAPESFGFTPLSPNIYVETGADEATRTKLRGAMEKAENAIRAAYGGVGSHPIVNACVSDKCYDSFGGMGSMAKVCGNRILLSPRGLNWHFIAHEWSHDEIRTRLTFSAWWHMPQWFDEGVAVAISEAPEHSENQWQLLVASNIPRPTPEELHTFKTMREWLSAIHRYGDDKNIERKARGEPEYHILYAAAGHEVRPWLAKVGSKGLLILIDRLNSGEQFESAFQTVNNKIERGAPQAALPLATIPAPSP